MRDGQHPPVAASKGSGKVRQGDVAVLRQHLFKKRQMGLQTCHNQEGAPNLRRDRPGLAQPALPPHSHRAATALPPWRTASIGLPLPVRLTRLQYIAENA